MRSCPLHTSLYQGYVLDFQAYLATLGYSSGVCRTLPDRLRMFLSYQESAGVYALSSLCHSSIEGFFSWLDGRYSTQSRDLLSNAYKNSFIQSLKLFFKYLSHQEGWSFSFEKPYYEEEARTKVILNQEEIKVLFAACPETLVGSRTCALLWLCYGCGLRIGEALALNVSDIRFRQRLVHIRRSKNGRERYVPMSGGVLAGLKTYLYEVRPQFLPLANESALLLSVQGRRIGSVSLSIGFRQLRRSVPGLSEKVTLHSLRHSIATHLLENGMKLEDIARFLGHTSLDSTQIYTHITKLY